MRDSVIQHTNEAIMRKQTNYSQQSKMISELSKEEFNAFLRIFILKAVQKDNLMPTTTMFNAQYCGDRYKAVMS